MTDHPRDDDLLRAALHAEADDVHADDALLARIRTATAPPSIWRRRTPLLAMAAAVAVVTGLAAVLLARDDKESVVLEEPDPNEVPAGNLRELLGDVDRCQALHGSEPTVRALVFMQPTTIDPDSAEHGRLVAARLRDLGLSPVLELTSEDVLDLLEYRYPDDPAVSAATLAEVPSAFGASFSLPDDATATTAEVSDLPGVWVTSVTDCRDHTDPTATTVVTGGDRPTLVALVREDGWLVTVDLETGEQRELHTEGDPTTPPEGFDEGGPQFIDAVDLSPDGEWIYFSTCCEPADGMTFRIPTEGGEVEEVGFGAYPRVSPAGRFVATAGSAHLYVRPTDDVGFDRQPALVEIGCCGKRLAWSPDGTELALVFGTGAEGETPQIRRFTWDGTTLAEADMGKPDNPGWFVLWNPDGMPVTFDGDPVADDRGRSQDASYGWILWIDEEGVVSETGFEYGDVTPIPGLPEAIAADW
ncbi:MAG: TolB family protein [Acidimicrobiia bacterium]